MPLHKALIVDDSRTAAALLGKMLSRLDLLWDQVDSGEECLSYLRSSVPDVIFMDHMMPGMDGFQTVKAILTQPELGFLPIVMHTSRQGVVYYGQARALGAVGVLQKPASQQDLGLILERVSTAIAERRATDLESVALKSSTRVSQFVAPVNATAMEGVELCVGDPSPPGLRASAKRLSLVESGSADGSSPATPEAAPAVPDPPAIPPAGRSMQAPEPLPDAGSAPSRLPRSGHFAALLLIAGLAIMMFWRPASLAEGDRQSLATALSVLVNQRVTYPEGGIPFDRERLLQLRQVVAILSSAGIAADIEMRAHVGEYCRVLVPGAGAALPAGDVPIEACDLIGYEPAEARRLAALQVSAFSDYVSRINSLDNGLSISIVPLGTAEPLQEYPPVSGIARALDWNRVAARNQRVETRILAPSSAR